jgi:hypothetical protein
MSTKLYALGCLVATVIFLLANSFNLTPSISISPSAGATSRSMSAGGCPHYVTPPLSIEWTGRDSMTVGFNGAINVEVQKHDFPGCYHRACAACAARAPRRSAHGSRTRPPDPFPHHPACPRAAVPTGDDFWSEVDQQVYQPNTFRVIEHILSRTPRGLYADLGSYVGPTVLFAGHFAASVLAVESDPQSFSTLNANLRLNPRVESRTRLVFGCVGDGGVVDFAGSGLPDSRRANGILPVGLREDHSEKWGLKTGGAWKHECRTLSALLEGTGLDARALALVNVDIVGSELWALPGLQTALAARGAKKPAVLLHVYAPLWDAGTALKQKAWDVVASFAYVYDENFQLLPRSTSPAFCEALGCTMLLSDNEFNL